jgi:phospholipase A-2-activating protein
MEKKIQELNDTVKAANGSVALRPEESANLTEIFGALSTNNTTSLTAQHVTLVSSVIERWPPAQAFPGTPFLLLLITSYRHILLVIDLLRLVLANNPSAFKSVSSKDAVLSTLLKAIDVNAPWDAPLPKPRDTNLLLVLRTLANMFQAPSGLVPAPWTSTVSIFCDVWTFC